LISHFLKGSFQTQLSLIDFAWHRQFLKTELCFLKLMSNGPENMLNWQKNMKISLNQAAFSLAFANSVEI